MRRLFNEYLLSSLTVIVGVIFISIFSSIIASASLKEDIVLPYRRNDVGVSIKYEIPKVNDEDFIIKDNIILKDSEFDYLKHISVKDNYGNDLSKFVTIDGMVDTKQTGLYDVKFKLRWNGKTIIKKASFYVKNKDDTYKISGKSYSGYKVSIYDENDNYMHFVRVNKDGSFEFKNIFNGKYRLYILGTSKNVIVNNSDVYVGELY